MRERIETAVVWAAVTAVYGGLAWWARDELWMIATKVLQWSIVDWVMAVTVGGIIWLLVWWMDLKKRAWIEGAQGLFTVSIGLVLWWSGLPGLGLMLVLSGAAICVAAVLMRRQEHAETRGRWKLGDER